MAYGDAAWNVNLWINNDEGLYNFARECVRRTKTKKQAAQRMLDGLHEMGVEKTPDGVKYTLSTIQKALVGI